MPCLDDNTIAALMAGTLSAQAQAEVREHLETCSSCRQLVAGMLRGEREGSSLSSGPTLPSPPKNPERQRGSTVGRYVVLEPIGAGGMGVVYAAYDPVLERKVALKLVRGEGDTTVRARLLREGKVVAQLSHPNVVAVFDMGTSEEQVFIAMELVEGGSLKRWLRAAERSPQEVLEKFLAAGEGLLAAHRAGLVHRDFKPENVLVGGDGRVRVTDFGLAGITEALGAAGAGASPSSAGTGAGDPRESGALGAAAAPRESGALGAAAAAPRESDALGASAAPRESAALTSGSATAPRASGALASPAAAARQDLGALTGAGAAAPRDFGAPAGTAGAAPRDSGALGPGRAATKPDAADGVRAPPSDRLTVEGTLLGTPRYMAPEQHARGGADALSDQFSFALALWEALYGVRPYPAGEGPATWRLQEPPEQARVAPWLRRVLQRGLSLAPSERYPDMAALLAALREDPARARSSRLRVAAGTTAALLAVALAAAWGSTRSARLCTGAPEQVTAVWNPGRIALLRAAFASTHAPGALETWELTRRGLDAWFTAWASQHTEACQATTLRGEQSEAVLDLRMACLGRRHAEANALLGVLQASSAEGVARAPEAVDALVPPSACSDVEVLRARSRPLDAQARALLDEAKARFDTGGYAEALERTGAAVARAQSVGDGPALASALLLRGRLEEHTGDLKAAEPTLLDAFAKAEAARDDATAGEAATVLSLVLGSRQARYAEAHSWLKLAEGTIGRAGNSASLQARLLQAQGLVAYAEGHLAEAILAHQRAVALFTKAEPGSLALADALNALGAALRGGRRATEALAAFDGALKLLLGKVGEDSDLVATTRNGMASALMLEGRFDEAFPLYQQALATFTQRLGPTHFRTVTTANNVGVVLAEQGRYAEALPWFAKVLAAREATLAPTDAKTADAHANLGMLLVELGRFDEALAHFEQARRILQGYPVDHFSQAESLLGVAKVHLARGKGALAKEPLGQVLALCEGKEGFRFDYTRARANFLLGRALAEGAPRKPAEGKALALVARAALVGFGPERFKRDIGEVDRWLATHP